MIDPLAVFLLLLGAATPILFAALGEQVAERAGVLNRGVEGMMIGGALAGFATAHATGSPALGFVAVAVAGFALAMLFAPLPQFLLSNQVATGLALTLFGLGLTAMFGKPYEGVKTPAMMAGPQGLNLIIWLGLAMVRAVWWFLMHARPGLILRAVGENHDAAHALGYPRRALRLAALGFGGAMAGKGGAYIYRDSAAMDRGDPAKEADAAAALIAEGVDVILQHTASTAPLVKAQEVDAVGFGQASDMANFKPTPRFRRSSTIGRPMTSSASARRWMAAGNPIRSFWESAR